MASTELVARVRALWRRSPRSVPPVLTAGDVRLDPHRRTATRGGRDLDLNNKEFGVLQELLAADGLVSAEQLLERVWDANIDPFTAVVRVTIAGLRRKLGAPPVIETIVGAGYRVVTQL